MSESGVSYQFVKGLYQTGLLLSNLAEMDRQSLPGEAWDEQGWQRFVQAGVETGLVSVGPELAGGARLRTRVQDCPSCADGEPDAGG